MIKKRLVQLLTHAKKYVACQVILQWLGLWCQVAVIWSAATLIEAAWQTYGRGMQTLTREMILLRAVIVVCALALKLLFDRLNTKASHMASVDVKRILREKIYAKLLRLGAGYRESAATSELVQLSAEGVEQLETYFGKYLSQLFYSLLAPITLFVILSFVSVRAAVVLLIGVPLMPMAIIVVQKIGKKILAKYWGVYASLGDSFLENLQGMTTLKIYQADAKKAGEMDAESTRFRKITMKVLSMQLNATIVMDIVAYGGAAAGMVVAVTQYLRGAIGVAGVMMIVLLAADYFIPLRVLGSYFHIAMNGMAASDKIFAFLDLPEPEERGQALDGGPVDIRMENVRFSYEEGSPILRGVSMDFPAGSFTSLVGLSGCGKSTAANVIMGRCRGYEGSIRIQGHELRELSEQSVMAHITMVGHESYIFKGTVRENLLMGKPGAGDEELRGALSKVNLLGFIDSQQGLDTKLLERGSNFSGGQRQRLALARALLHDTPVYIFDEATSNIDAESEALIMDVIHELARTRTVILISHRLANVVASDRIYMLAGGEVAESGGHDALMAAGGAYKALYDRQRELEKYARAAHHEAAAFEDAPAAPISEADTSERAVPRRSGAAIMAKLIVLIKPLLPVMLLAVLLGVLGYLCAISLTIMAGGGVARHLAGAQSLGALLPLLVVFAVMRGVLHYGEQYCNHFIAFRLLAIIRHKVFAALRRLCPAKLEGRDRGNLISIITSDIELLEVFYAHTISPIAIAFLISVIMVVFIGAQYAPAAVIALLGYVVVGVVIPLWNGRRSAAAGMAFRDGFGELNSFVLDSLRGVDETIQYGQGGLRMGQITERSRQLSGLQKTLARFEASQRSVTNLVIELCSFGMLFFLLSAYGRGAIGFSQFLTGTVAMMGSFGPVVALSSLSNNLNQTLASGERVLSLVEETPQVAEVTDGETVAFAGAKAENVSFSYGAERILSDYSIELPEGRVVGIHGASGSGKSTLLKLLMRFWDADEGRIAISGKDVRRLNTANLRDMESYVTQETYLFHDSVANNIAVGRLSASREEIMEAAGKAAVHDFIMTLPQGYDTEVGELGDTLSGGERQRIGLARAFLHGAPFMLLDEPTSNLDSLNEGVILSSLAEEAKQKTIVLVSHRASTMNIADTVYEMAQGRLS